MDEGIFTLELQFSLLYFTFLFDTLCYKYILFISYLSHIIEMEREHYATYSLLYSYVEYAVTYTYQLLS